MSRDIEDLTPEKAQGIHDFKRITNKDHDQVSCWCCCWDCEFDDERRFRIVTKDGKPYWETVSKEAAKDNDDT